MKVLKNPMNGFKYAFEGVVQVVRTQRHMRFHFLVLGLVLIVSLGADLGRLETLLLLFTVSLVLVAEMFNTAIEAVVDMITQTYHPLAKFAKDIAAGAVLIATLNALAVGVLLFFGGDKVRSFRNGIGIQKPDWLTVATVAVLLLIVLVVMWKVAGGKGKLWKGGIVSGHAALGFFLATTILFVPNRIAVGVMAYLLALLVAQSRVEGGIHTLGEVVTGGLVATGLALIVYVVLSPLVF